MSFHSRGIGRNAVAVAVALGNGLQSLSDAARAAPMLKADEERRLFLAWRDEGDASAQAAIVRSHMRLVISRASRYRNYGLPLQDLVSEGCVGLVDGLYRFDPDRGFRVSTYVSWWIEASLKQYVIANWSLVKIGTTRDQKRLFFGLRGLKARLGAVGDGEMAPDTVEAVATALDVDRGLVVEMNRRMAGSDASLNAPMNGDGDDWMDVLRDESQGIEEGVVERDLGQKRVRALREALARLNDRERDIIMSRRLADEPRRLEELAQAHGVSRERIRQVETRALEKLALSVRDICATNRMELPRLAA